MKKSNSEKAQEKTGITNPHDELFRKQFQNPKSILPILRTILPVEAMDCLKLETLHQKGIQLSTKALRRSIPDLLFTCECKNGSEALIHFVFEHKSYKDEKVAVQVLLYMALIWDHYRLKGKQLPYIIPVIFYHNAEEWTPKRLDELLPQGSALLEYVPKFSMPFYDLARQPEEQLRQNLKENAILLFFYVLLHPTEQLERKFAEAIVLLNKVFDDD